MHLLTAKPGGYADDEGITYVEQTPGDIVILSAQDTDLSLLARAVERLPEDYPSVRLTSLLYLRQHASVDLYLDQVLSRARLILVSLLGGVAYWSYGVERVQELARRRGIPLGFVPGDDHPDEELVMRSTMDGAELHRLWRYLREGGPHNATQLFHYLGARHFGRDESYEDPRPLPRVMVYHPAHGEATLDHWRKDWQPDRPVALLLFYRAHLQAGNVAAFDGFIETLRDADLNPLPVALASLKDSVCLEVVNGLAEQAAAAVILNTTGFSLSRGEGPWQPPYSRDVPVLQPILSGSSVEDWRRMSLGLRPSDLAMNVVLPEMDGRIISRAISFKDFQGRVERTESDLVGYRLLADRARFVAALAANWARLGDTANADKRIALILANYPTREGRIGNGVGLDTPASTVNILRAMQQAGYPVSDLPADGDELMRRLLDGVTNDLDTLEQRYCFQSLPLDEYRAFFASLPEPNRRALLERWGPVENDPRVRRDRIMIPGIRLGLTFVGIQPARGYDLDPAASYHDPDLVPTHAYLAFYLWLRTAYQAHAVIHVGKHGNLEWLPGKGTALSGNCWPEIALGPLPHLYPFIVNDPGEGAQAKRRAQAVIIDHLVPPLTRAETYGALRDLETLVDEYYQAQNLDSRRAERLRGQILRQIEETDLHRELMLDGSDEDETLNRVDAYLCELKEAQIRGGLHIFGESPRGERRTDTLLALARLPREADGPTGLLHALARDLHLGEDYDPLDGDFAAPWNGPRPALLAAPGDAPWRNHGDTRERLERLARRLLEAGSGDCDPALAQTRAVLERIEQRLAPDLDACGRDEIAHLLAGLEGRFVPPGPSGAPSRGRLDVLPTGRNFYSVDTRAIPTPTAWTLGWNSATQLIERHLQEHGDYPRSLGLSVWGTATMRTGGDDIAVALALIGARPVWAAGSARVTDFEILPASVLGRPRVDVTLRISGFFRDAFMNVVRLFDAAVQAVAEVDEPADINPLRARVQEETAHLEARGLDRQEARAQATWRVFGSRPGAYGAGLQGLIDERLWQDGDDLAEAYLNWGSYAYGRQDDGTRARDAFRTRLGSLEVVLQNQDNREHDILDSDDYYQFQGGMTAAVRSLSGSAPSVYHADHADPSRPRIRRLEEEIARVVRSRAVNPKWIEAIKQHGYKGAFEMAATVDYLFAYDATTGLVQDHQYALVADAYVLDDDTREFFLRTNPNALHELTERLIEAIQRGMWKEPGDYPQRLEEALLEAGEGLEGGPAPST
jgi:cobaltochelatase CobN